MRQVTPETELIRVNTPSNHHHNLQFLYFRTDFVGTYNMIPKKKLII